MLCPEPDPGGAPEPGCRGARRESPKSPLAFFASGWRRGVGTSNATRREMRTLGRRQRPGDAPVRKLAAGILVGLLVGAASAAAASRYVITSTRQIKPSVLSRIESRSAAAVPVRPVWVTGPASQQVSTAECPKGDEAIGGGYGPERSSSTTLHFTAPVVASHPVAADAAHRSGWQVELEPRIDWSELTPVEAYAECVPRGAPVAG